MQKKTFFNYFAPKMILLNILQNFRIYFYITGQIKFPWVA